MKKITSSVICEWRTIWLQNYAIELIILIQYMKKSIKYFKFWEHFSSTCMLIIPNLVQATEEKARFFDKL